MLNGKPKPEIANVKKRLDSVFGSYNKFSEMINSAAGLTSSIYGVPSSSSLGHRTHHIPSTSYVLINSQPSSANVSRSKIGSESSGYVGNGYSTVNVPRPPTKDVLQDNSVPSTSKGLEHMSKLPSSPKMMGVDRKRTVLDLELAKPLDTKHKKLKKEEKSSSAKIMKSDNHGHAAKLNRELQEELFGDFLSDDDFSHQSNSSTIKLEKNCKKASPTPCLSNSTTTSAAITLQLSPPPLINSKPEREKCSKTLKSEKLSSTNTKELMPIVTQETSPRIVLKISRPLSNCSTLPASSKLADKEPKEKKKKKDKEYKSKKLIKEDDFLNQKKIIKEPYTKSYPQPSIIGGVDLPKTGKLVASNVSPESNDLHSPDSGFVDVMSNGGLLLGGGGASRIHPGKAINSRNFDSRTDVETILEHFGRVSPLLSPICSILPQMDSSTHSPVSNTRTPKLSSPFAPALNDSQNLMPFLKPLSGLDVSKPEDIKNVIKESKIVKPLSKLSYSMAEELSSKVFPCQLKLGSSMANLFFLPCLSKDSEKIAKKSKNKSIMLESIDKESPNTSFDKIDENSSCESELAQKQAIFEQRIRIKDDVIESHELVIAQQRTRLQNLEKISKKKVKEMEAYEKTITVLKKENETLAKRSAFFAEKIDRMSVEMDRMTREMEELKKQLHFRN